MAPLIFSRTDGLALPLDSQPKAYPGGIPKALRGRLVRALQIGDLRKRVGRNGSVIIRTRTQRVRTAAELPREVALLDTVETPTHQAIAPRLRRLRGLRLSDRSVTRRLGATGQTVGKTIR